MGYLEEGRRIWADFVPPAGQASTRQGELLRAVEKLRDEAVRNGNGNWDKGFETLPSYLERYLLDARVFRPDALHDISKALSRLRDFEYPVFEDELYDFLGDRVVDYYRHYGSTPHTIDPSLYR